MRCVCVSARGASHERREGPDDEKILVDYPVAGRRRGLVRGAVMDWDGVEVRVLVDATRPVAAEDGRSAIQEMEAAGAFLEAEG